MEKLARVFLAAAAFLTLVVLSDLRAAKFPQRGLPCLPDDEGSWSIGLYKGPSPLNLTPIESSRPRLNSPGASAWPISNPIFTCASVTDASNPSNFVADPFLFPGYAAALAAPRLGGVPPPLHLFFETKSNINMRGEIGVAESRDGGATWKHLGIALSEPWHLSYPHVFEWAGDAYMLPEGFSSGGLRLYRATDFPLKWEFVAEIISKPLIDSSLVQWDDLWYLFASDPSRPGHKSNAELQIFHAESPLGPWKPHFLNPVMSGDVSAGARMAGRLVKHDKRLYRFGQDCAGTYGRGVVAYRVETLSPTEFKQRRVSFRAGKPPRRGQAAWNGARRHHIDAMKLPDGTWLAVMDGDYQDSNPLTRPLVKKALFLAGLWAAGVVIMSAAVIGGRRRAAGGGGGAFSRAASWDGSRSRGPSLPAVVMPIPRKRGGSFSSLNSSESPVLRLLCGPVGAKRWLKAFAWDAAASMLTVSKPKRAHFPPAPSTVRGRIFILLGAAFIFASLAGLGSLSITCANFVKVIWEVPTAASAVAVDGAYSQFSAVILSQPSRVPSLESVVAHYSRCPSLTEIVVVWSGIEAGDEEIVPKLPLYSAGVRVRVRIESETSSGVRFRPDLLLKTRAVLSLDDDVLLPCADVEVAFATWRQDPDALVGFFPQLVVPGPPIKAILDGGSVLRAGRYNALQSKALFLDGQRAFDLYWADSNAQARAVAEKYQGCEDLFMNYLWAAAAGNRTSGEGGVLSQHGSDVASVRYIQSYRQLELSTAPRKGVGSGGKGQHTGGEAECIEKLSQLLGGGGGSGGGFPFKEESIIQIQMPLTCATFGIGCP